MHVAGTYSVIQSVPCVTPIGNYSPYSGWLASDTILTERYTHCHNQVLHILALKLTTVSANCKGVSVHADKGLRFNQETIPLTVHALVTSYISP